MGYSEVVICAIINLLYAVANLGSVVNIFAYSTGNPITESQDLEICREDVCP